MSKHTRVSRSSYSFADERDDNIYALLTKPAKEIAKGEVRTQSVAPIKGIRSVISLTLTINYF